ncbi:MAG: branched-chain amino acid ABC transporter permease [Erysipelotrichaceae bacterium]|nr:branched-chain amino acid ABC transporter permease [Erysipelotrichaceae bacterium]MDY6035288.1 branched-chain amino acid ABC transporter permease [Bulleidia sp.]
MKKLSMRNRVFLEFAITLVVYIICSLLMRAGILTSYWQGVLMSMCINVILTVSLNMTAGFLGELALGHAGFMAVGAYASAFFSKSLRLLPVLEFPLAILVGGIVAMAFGLLVCLPTLRLRGDYLAIITLAFGEIVRNILINLKVLGGAGGYTAISRYANFTWAFVLAALTVFLSLSLIHSRHGRSIIAIREDEIAAESSGVNTRKYKIITFLFSAFFAGVGGALYAHYMGFLQPSIFTLDKSIEILVMVVLGGMGNIFGSVISAGVLTLLPEVLRSVSDYRMLVYAIVLILMMLIKNAPKVQLFLQRFKRSKEVHS